MAHMFNGTKAFNQPLDRWNLTAAQTITGMFRNSLRFNQPLIAWDIAAIPNKRDVLIGALAFDQPETMAVWRAASYTD
jgi:hypothetical protein